MSSVHGTPRMPDHPPPHFTLDQQVALRASAARLARDVDGAFSPETIERFLVSSYTELADRATVKDFLPLLAELFARQRLTALARIDAAVGWSGGTEPATRVDPAPVAVMAERGIDISGEYPKPWTGEVVQAADVVVTMGRGECPVLPGKRYEDWTVDDPAGLAPADVRRIRDDIERHVLSLVDELHPHRAPA